MQSKGINFYDVVFADELNRLRDNVLYNQFKNKPIIDIAENKFILYDKYMEFINNTALFIVEKLFNK